MDVAWLTCEGSMGVACLPVDVAWLPVDVAWVLHSYQ